MPLAFQGFAAGYIYNKKINAVFRKKRKYFSIKACKKLTLLRRGWLVHKCLLNV